jgi:hypothetical protein
VPEHIVGRSLAEVGIVYGTVPFVWMTMLPGSRAGEVSGRVSLVPLRSSVDDVLLNTAGAGLAALASRRWWRTAAGASSPAQPTSIAPVPGR